MSTVAADAGLWTLVDRKLERPAPEGDGLWTRLGVLVDPNEFRPKLADDIEVKEFDKREGGSYFMVANTRDLIHYRLEAPDYELVKLMDGTRTVKEIVVERFRETGEMELGGLIDLVHQLHAENFLEQRYTDVDQVLDKAMHPSSRGVKAREFAKTLTVKWEDPERAVKWAYEHGLKWVLTKPFVLLGTFLALSGIAAFVANVRSKLFGLTGKSLAIGFFVLLAIQYGMIGVHELGHALVLFKNGRRMKNAGFQIYFGCPAFFVDASDGLMMSRGQRVLQAFAGPFGQAVGAGVASLIAWAFPQWVISETLYRYTVLAYLNIFLNCVPLLELDGYWMLSDWLRIPDLRPRSMQFLRYDLFHKIRTRERFGFGDLGLLLYGVLGLIATVLLLLSGFFFWKILFGGLVISLWNGGIETRIILVALALFVLNPVIRGLVNLVRATVQRVRALAQRIRFRLQRRWRVEAALLIDELSLFDDVPEDVLSSLAGRVRLKTVRTGQVVVRQGERAQAFYVVRKGAVRVVEEHPSTGEEIRVLRTLGRGEAFGEVGLAEAARRSATVRAAENSELFEIDKGTFDELLADRLRRPEFAPTLQRVAELRGLSAFAHLEIDELAELASRGSWVNVPPGQTLIEQGDVGDAFYAIAAGQVDVTEDGTYVRTMGPGSHVGEIALLLDVPRTATVRATTPVRAFRIDRDGFDAMIKDSFRRGTLNPTISLDRVETH